MHSAQQPGTAPQEALQGLQHRQESDLQPEQPPHNLINMQETDEQFLQRFASKPDQVLHNLEQLQEGIEQPEQTHAGQPEQSHDPQAQQEESGR